MDSQQTSSVFEAVYYVDGTYRVELNRPHLEIVNILSEELHSRENLEDQPLALNADNGILYVGNAHFTQAPMEIAFPCIKQSMPKLKLLGPETGWSLCIAGTDVQMLTRNVCFSLIRQLVELRIEHEVLKLRISAHQ